MSMLRGRLASASPRRWLTASTALLVACSGERAAQTAGAADLGQTQAAQVAPESPATLALSFTLDGHTFRLDLERAGAPTTSDYRTFTRRRDGRLVTLPPSPSGCLYRGRVEALDGGSDPGWALVDACRGPSTLEPGAAVAGLVRANGRFWRLEPGAGAAPAEHVLSPVYRLDAPDVTFAEPRRTELRLEPVSVAPRLEFREGTEAETKYIDLIMVSDAARVSRLGGQTERDTIQLVAAMNALLEESGLVPRVRVTLRAQVLFEADPYAPTFSGNEVNHDSLLDEFLNWARNEEELPDHDEHVLLSGLDFLGATAGLAGLGVACSTSLNGFIVQADRAGAGFPILSAVHELGHTLGMDHDSTGNDCPQSGFIMAAVGCGNCPIDGAQFSSCSSEAFAAYLAGPAYAEGGLCGDDVPPAPGLAACGDGVVSGGEECDCGGADCADIDPCCEGETCQLRADAECSDFSDGCCQGCQIVSDTDVVCRAARSSCDAAETCSGASKDCPPDTFLPAGDDCEDDRGNAGACYFGDCRSRGTQCELIAEQQNSPAFDDVGAPGPNCAIPCNQVICGNGPTACIVINGPGVIDGVSCAAGGQCVNGACVTGVDQCPSDPGKTDPGACGCGRADTDGDGDDTPDCVDGCPDDGAKTTPRECGCNSPDADTDSDGALDCDDGCASDPAKREPGPCGCGTPDTDSDGDGSADCNDECPADATRSVAGACGCGAPDTDSDRDGTFDCDDECPEDARRVAPPCGAPNDGDGDGAISDDSESSRAFSASASGGCSLGAARGVAGASFAWLALLGAPLFLRRRKGLRRSAVRC